MPYWLNKYFPFALICIKSHYADIIFMNTKTSSKSEYILLCIVHMFKYVKYKRTIIHAPSNIHVECQHPVRARAVHHAKQLPGNAHSLVPGPDHLFFVHRAVVHGDSVHQLFIAVVQHGYHVICNGLAGVEARDIGNKTLSITNRTQQCWNLRHAQNRV